MADFCKECFIKVNKCSSKEIKAIVLSNYKDYCEKCGKLKNIVDYLDFDRR